MKQVVYFQLVTGNFVIGNLVSEDEDVIAVESPLEIREVLTPQGPAHTAVPYGAPIVGFDPKDKPIQRFKKIHILVDPVKGQDNHCKIWESATMSVETVEKKLIVPA